VIVVDTSALFASLTGEPERERILATIASTPNCLMSAASYVECCIVLTARFGEQGAHHLRLFLHEAGIDLVDVDRDQAELAVDAWMRFGRGRHPAALNYGDCFAYALAASRGAPLLYVGDDFTATGLARA
jgi:ribonuclease VapC